MLSILKSKVAKLFVISCIAASTIHKTSASREFQAIQIVQDLLKTQEQLKAEPLVGGLSEASLITVSSDDQAYVVRFLGKNISVWLRKMSMR